MERSRDRRTRSSGSVRIFYPAFDKTELLRALRERLGRLESELPLVTVVLFMVRDGVTLLG